MKHKNTIVPSLEEVHASVSTENRKSWKRFLAFLGPAYLVSVGYMDPGNWATDLEGGSRYGYALIWVLVMSNLMAIVLQSLCTRLGIVGQRDLAQVNRETYPPVINFCLYLLAETAIAATDLAEVIGMAIGLHLLTGIPLLWGVLITVLDTFLLLYLQKLGIRKMEAFIIALIAVIFGSFVVELIFVKPSVSGILSGLKPSLPDDNALYIAIGIIGATVMPHNLYLHSALVQTRKVGPTHEDKRRALRYNLIDSTVALNLALFVNAAILILAAAVFHQNNFREVASIDDAHRLLEPLVGEQLAPILFAIALIAAGQSSTVTGTLAGQIVMEGYLKIRFNPWIRRLVTRLVAVIPALITIWVAGEEMMTDLLILSQVILSVQLAFAIIPLIYAVSDKNRMKEFTISLPMKLLAGMITLIILYLNIRMIVEKSWQVFLQPAMFWTKFFVGIGLILFVILLIITILYPLRGKPPVIAVPSGMHGAEPSFDSIVIRPYQRIAMALDFSSIDERILMHAMQQGQTDTHFVCIHIVESAGANILGKQVADQETLEDMERLVKYATYLRQQNRSASVHLGYYKRVQEIVRICKEEKVDLLIMGAHGHKGMSDILWGQTIDGVRHNVDIPVLIVS